MRFGSYIKRVEESSIAGLKRDFDALNNYLASHTFLVGDGVTLVEGEEAAKPKLNNPLDLLPPSKMVLDDL
ncbi:putative elongation factor 1B gamma, glutathione S-transferase domain superfamily [Helianthus anomalus]